MFPTSLYFALLKFGRPPRSSLPSVGDGYPTNKSQVYVSNWFTVAFPNITDSSFFDLALSALTPKNDPITLLHSFAIKSSMFNGDCCKKDYLSSVPEETKI